MADASAPQTVTQRVSNGPAPRRVHALARSLPQPPRWNRCAARLCDCVCDICFRQMALLETPGGQRWRLRTDAPEIAIEPSIYWGGASPCESLQITLRGEADPMGHGLSPPNRIRWALARA